MDLFRHPELLDDAAKLIEDLKYQTRVVECFERTKKNLETPLGSNVLKKCATFVGAVNRAIGSGFHQEISKLTLDELGFCAISLDDRRLKVIGHAFRASHVQAYMISRRVSCTNHPELFKRLEFCGQGNEEFLRIYNAAKQVNETEVSPPSSLLKTGVNAQKKLLLGAATCSSSNSTSTEQYHSALERSSAECSSPDVQCDRKRKREEERQLSTEKSTRAPADNVADKSRPGLTVGLQMVLNMASLDNIKDVLQNYLVVGMKRSSKRRKERTSNNLTDAVNLHMPQRRDEDCVLKIWVCSEIGKQILESKMEHVDELRDMVGDFLFKGMESSYFRQGERDAGVFTGTNALQALRQGEDYRVEIFLNFDTVIKALPVLYPGY